jgi:hypothetical protein
MAFCANCGTAVDSEFCVSCGHRTGPPRAPVQAAVSTSNVPLHRFGPHRRALGGIGGGWQAEYSQLSL